MNQEANKRLHSALNPFSSRKRVFLWENFRRGKIPGCAALVYRGWRGEVQRVAIALLAGGSAIGDFRPQAEAIIPSFREKSSNFIKNSRLF